MGKHSGDQDPNDIVGPHGSGPHPTLEESHQKAQEFEDQWERNGGE